MSLLKRDSFFYCAICLWVCFQLFLIVHHWDFALHDDALSYRLYAEHCVNNSTWYPDNYTKYGTYIFAPGYVNLLILTKHMFGSYLAINFINLIFNVSVLFFIYAIAKKLFSKEIAKIAAYLFMLLYSNLYIVIAPTSDLPYLFLVMFAMYLLLSGDTARNLIFAGILLSLANWIRPLVITFLIPIFLYMICFKYRKISYLYLIVSYILIQLSIGYFTYRNSGIWVASSTTSGFNLAMCANDNPRMGLMNGNFKSDSFYQNLDLAGKVAPEKDKIYRERALQYIKAHPWDYLGLIPFKFIFLHSCDNWSERVLPGAGFSKLIHVLSKLYEDNNFLELFKRLSIVFIKSIFFYIATIGFCGYIVSNAKELLFRKENIFILIPLLNICALMFFPIVDRYHYPYVPILIMYASCFFYRKFATFNRDFS